MPHECSISNSPKLWCLDSNVKTSNRKKKSAVGLKLLNDVHQPLASSVASLPWPCVYALNVGTTMMPSSDRFLTKTSFVNQSSWRSLEDWQIHLHHFPDAQTSLGRWDNLRRWPCLSLQRLNKVQVTSSLLTPYITRSNAVHLITSIFEILKIKSDQCYWYKL